MDAAVALRAWRPDQVQAFAEALQAALSPWAAAWGLRVDGAAAVRCEPVRVQLPGPGWEAAGATPVSGAWIAQSQETCDALARELFAGECSGPIAGELARVCQGDAVDHLLAALPVGDAAAALALGDCAGPWSGSLDAVLPWGLRLRLHGTIVERAMARFGIRGSPSLQTTPLACVSTATQDMPVTLSVQLQACDVDIGSLQGLQVGDVLRVQHPLATPLAVRDAHGAAVCSGFLVRSGSQLAVELAPAGAP